MRLIPDSLEDLSDNPEKFGIPTFEEFVKNKSKYQDAPDEWLRSIDRGDPILGCRQKYFVEGYRVDTLEQAERIARDMGFNLYDDFILDPQLRSDQDGKVLNEVNFRAKRTIERRMTW